MVLPWPTYTESRAKRGKIGTQKPTLREVVTRSTCWTWNPVLREEPIEPTP